MSPKESSFIAPGAASVAAAFQQAVALHRQGRPFQADAACAEVLRVDPRHFGAWHLRGLLAIESGNDEQGMEWIERSLKIQPGQPAAHSNLGNALLSAKQPQRALESFERALRLKSDYYMALFNRGNALRELGRFDEALGSYDRALRLQSDSAQAHNNRGLVLLELGRLDDAVAAFQNASKLDASFAGSRENLTRTLIRRGDIAQNAQRLAAALDDYGQALALEPDCVVALINSGNVLMKTSRAEAALARYDRALQLSPGLVDGLINRAAALQDLRRYEEAIESFAQVVDVAPERNYVLGCLFHARQDACDWTDYESLTARLLDGLEKGARAVNPVTQLLLPATPAMLLDYTRALTAAEYPPDLSLGPLHTRVAPAAEANRIRVAYVSADFRDHPVSYALAGVFERHDRSAFEIVAISLRPAQAAGLGERLRAAFDQFIEIENRTDGEVAQLLRALEVDIAVDLNGLTEGLRPGIFAHRVAPVQVSFLGYAGTLGAPYMDYLLADPVVIPAGDEQYYSEQVVRLPHCYLPTDDRREIGPLPTRAQAGLPDTGLVFCAFTNAYKINPPVFDIWMRLLGAIAGSVLWLGGIGTEARQNLQRAAQARGVDPDRLVFAPRVASMAEHLGRQALADLYLDTLPYNAHSTACEALWVGVPVLTCAGGTFASRVAASALTAVGLPELITHSLAEYEAQALELAQQPQRLQELRERLAQQRHTAPLFDTARFCGDLEAAYRTLRGGVIRGGP